MKFVIVRESILNDDIKKLITPRLMKSGQYLIRALPEIEKYLIGYKRYTGQEILELDDNSNALLIEHENNINDKQLQAFKSKVLPCGRKLYRRHNGYTFPVSIGQNNIEITVPYPHVKLDYIKIINCVVGESLNFHILDDIDGTLTGYPKYNLNTFGSNVNMEDGTFVDDSRYDADLVLGMIVNIEYTSLSEKVIYINIPFHEIK